jgi:hypothetical protein
MQRNKFSSSSKNVRLRRSKLRDEGHIPRPPRYLPEVVIGWTFRYQCSAAISNLQITNNNLAQLVYMASTTTVGYPIYSPYKIRRVQIWSPMASDLVPVTCSIEFTKADSSGSISRAMLVSDTSMGASTCAYVDAKPRSDSMAALYQYPSTDGFMRITCPTASVIDVHVTFVLAASSAVASLTTSGLTAGRLYYGRLDGAGGDILPVGGVLASP